MTTVSKFKKTLMDDEGLRLKAYQDHLGVWTIGYGTNLQTLEITERQARKWLDDKLEWIESQLVQHDGYDLLNGARKDVVRSMAYQMGVNGTFNFKNMWRAIRCGDFDWAGREMRDSKWWKDPKTKGRAERMAKRMEQGVWDFK